MQVRAKLVAVFISVILGTGVASGVAMADESTVGITLNGGTTTCSVVSTSASLGSYNWVNGQYQVDPNDPGKVAITVSISEAKGDSGDTCDVSAWLGPLATTDTYMYLTAPINLTSESAGANFYSPEPLARSDTAPSKLVDAVGQGAYAWDVQPIAAGTLFALAPGTYSGTLTLTAKITGEP